MLSSYVRPFDQRDPRYRVCCGLVPAIYTAYVICLIDLLTAMGLLIGVIFGNTGLVRSDYLAYLGSAVVSLLLVLAAIVLTIIGLVTGKAGCLIMHLIIRILACLAFITAAVLFGVALIQLDSDPNAFIADWKRGVEREKMRKMARAAFQVQCSVYAMLVPVQFWFFTILLGAYRYVRDKRPVVLTEYSIYS